MWELGGLLCAGLKRSVNSMLPWDVPWYDPSHAIFFAALYGALSVIGIGLLAAVIITFRRMSRDEGGSHH
ncbi:MAG: hypothetical protein MUF52_02900 [Syntrophobacteraceae bacterium]|jgi:hypothetical protein|nr:hypothetical protein [Syntrophobacteraceae bacterium]